MSEHQGPAPQHFATFEDLFGSSDPADGLAETALSERLGGGPIAIEPRAREFTIPSVRASSHGAVYAQTRDLDAGFGEQMLRFLDECGCSQDAFERVLAVHGLTPRDFNNQDIWHEDRAYPALVTATAAASAQYRPVDGRRPESASVDVSAEVLKLAEGFREQAARDRDGSPQQRWNEAVVECMRRVAPMLDPIRYSQNLEPGVLDAALADAALHLVDHRAREFEQFAEANPEAVPWAQEFALFAQIEYLRRTIDDARVSGASCEDVELVVDGVRTGDITKLFIFSCRTNPEAREHLDRIVSDGVGPAWEVDGGPAPQELLDRDPLIVDVDPRNLAAPRHNTDAEMDEPGVDKQATRRQAANRLLSVANGQLANAQDAPARPPSRPVGAGGAAPPRSALPPPPARPGPGTEGMGR